MATTSTSPFQHDDLIHTIIIHLLDFQSLMSIILVSKNIRNVFHTHPNTIIRSVAENVVGPALRQALRLVRAPNTNDLLPRWEELPDEEFIMAEHIAMGEALALSRNGEVVRELEALFSWRYKNPSSRNSKLTATESLRFQRAMYRYWIFCRRFEVLNARKCPLEQEKAHSLEFLTTSELHELQAVHYFIKQTSRWAIDAFGGPLHMDLTLDPSATFRRFRSGTRMLPSMTALKPHDLQNTLQSLGQIRGVDLSTWRGNSGYIVLLDVDEWPTRQCQRCAHHVDVDTDMLWNESNWDLLRGFVPPYSTSLLLDGRLSHNAAETEPLRQTLQHTNFSYLVLMREMFENRNPSDGWSKSDWLCIDCVRAFMKAHLRSWWIVRKQNEGLEFKEDCWWGFDCRTQCHKWEHATRLNHLCEPSREDVEK